jgi:GntR family transcriptional regulator/MocR family aminotransferase
VDLHVRLEGRKDLARQLYRELRGAIVEGRIRPGERLPSTRELASRLQLSRNTVALAYEWLASEGFVSGRRLVSAQLRPKALNGRYGDCAGHPALRDAIANHVGAARGVQADAEDVIITYGAQHAFDLLARVLIEPGTRAAMEDPGYPPIRSLLESFGAAVVGVKVDEEGLRVDALPSDARLVYVTPSHQYPLGMPMSQARRLALLAWARERNAVVIEDDYDSEFRFGGRPLDALHASDRGGRVAYVGTFSKTLLPKLRLGFLIAPKSLQEALKTAYSLSAWHCQWPALAQRSISARGPRAEPCALPRQLHRTRTNRLVRFS